VTRCEVCTEASDECICGKVKTRRVVVRMDLDARRKPIPGTEVYREVEDRE